MGIIECTIQMKHEAQEHYERLAEEVTDTELKRLFTLLASAEQEHANTLEKLKDNEKLADSDFIALSGRVCTFRPFLDSKHLSEELRKDPDAYHHIIAGEAEAIRLYDQLAAQSNVAEVKKLCQMLADQEREHFMMIENIYSYVEEPRTYLEWGEFSNLGHL